MSDIEKYYANVSPAVASQLQALRSIIKEVLKGAEEKLSYEIPHFVYNGKKAVAIGGYTEHVSLHPLGGRQIKKFASGLKPYKTSTGTIQFSLGEKLPKPLIKKIVSDRLQELFP